MKYSAYSWRYVATKPQALETDNDDVHIYLLFFTFHFIILTLSIKKYAGKSNKQFSND